MDTPELEQLINEAAAAQTLAVVPTTLKEWRLRGVGPPYIRVGRMVRYRPSDLARFLRDRTVCAADRARSQSA